MSSSEESKEFADLSTLLKQLGEELKHIKTLEPEDFPVTVKKVRLGSGIKPSLDDVAVGRFVSVRPAGENQKTYLGIYLGELPVYMGQTVCSLDTRNDTLIVSGFTTNPAMFVPELNKVVWGMESWWGEIASPEHLREITDKDIQNIWYVKAMQQFAKKEES